MTYSEKLRDPRWREFRQEFIRHCRRSYEEPPCCESCGAEGNFHVHHKKYIEGREPWEYNYDDLRLLCAECHGVIHDVEQRVRALTLSLQVHHAEQFDVLVDELIECLNSGCVGQAIGHAKEEVRQVFWSNHHAAMAEINRTIGSNFYKGQKGGTP